MVRRAEAHLAAQDRARRRLDHVVALELHVVEVARGHHPRRQLLAHALDAPAEILLGVKGAASHARVDRRSEKAMEGHGGPWKGMEKAVRASPAGHARVDVHVGERLRGSHGIGV